MDQIHGGGGGGGGIAVTTGSRFDTLPEDCISMVISHTSPQDACVVASVSKTFKSAAQSDLVWEMFLPSEYSSFVPRSANHLSKKEIFKSLAHDSVLIEDGKKSFWLEKASGKKCYMLSAMDLAISWGDTSRYWQWITVPESKFKKVAELRIVCWFEIRGKISCEMLSKGTYYSVYLVFKRANGRPYGFDLPVEAKVGFVGKEATKRSVFLEEEEEEEEEELGGGLEEEEELGGRLEEEKELEEEEEEASDKNVEEPKERGDGWREVELGKFYIDNKGCEEDSDEIEISIMEIHNGHCKGGLIFQGIEIRPARRN